MRLKIEADIIKNRRKYNLYQNSGIFVIFLAYGLLLLFNYQPVKPYLPFQLPEVASLILLFGAMAISIVLARLARPYSLPIEERLFLKVFSALESIASYINDKKEVDRKDAQTKLEQISTSIKIWNAGALKVCKSE